MTVTRLAPSPTGNLHLGNAWSFLLCWLAARKQSGRVLLRMDDIDPQRAKKEHVDAAMRDLAWLGLDWDGEPVFQSSRQPLYAQALQKIKKLGLAYPCFCTRKELRAIAGAPHQEDRSAPYPGACASLSPARQKQLISQGRAYSLRMRCNGCAIDFTDLIQGRQCFSHTQYGGDFPLMRSDGVWSYQLASAIDDEDMGVNLVVRGRDLLESTCRQLVLGKVLGWRTPSYAHVPLLRDAQGARLAKRHHSLALNSLANAGVKPAAITGLLGQLAGINPAGMPATPGQLLKSFELRFLAKDDICLQGRLLKALQTAILILENM